MFKSKSLLIACLVIVLSMALIFPLSIVNADYSDIVEDSTAIVNFNQLVNMTSSSSTAVVNSYSIKVLSVSTGNLTDYNLNINIISGHKYYVKTSTNSIRFIYTNGNGSSFYGNSVVVAVETGTLMYINYNPVYGSISVGEIISCNIIDLSAMFGLGSEPSFSECQELFVADYYSYNSGSAVSLSGLNSYAQGVQSVYDTLTYNYVGEDSYNLLQPYAFYRGSTYYNGAPSQEQSHISVASVDGDGWSSGNGFALYYPFTSSLLAGDTITLNGMLGSATDMGIHQQATTYIIIRYGDVINDVLSVNNIVLQDADTYNINSFTYTLPSDATGLVFYSTQPFRIKDFTIKVRSLSINNLIDSAYKNGYDNGYNPYKVGGSGYQSIYTKGYNAGVLSENPYTFGALMSSVIEAPLGAVLNVFNFDFLGYNLKNVVTLLLTLCIILAIVNLFLGGKNA